MEPIFKVEEWVKVKDSGPGIHRGQVGWVVDNRCSEVRPLYLVNFFDGAWGFFEEDELIKIKNIPCPKCAFERVGTELSEPYRTDEGLVQDCSKGHKIYLYGVYRAEGGEVIDLLTGKSLKIFEEES